LPIADAELKHFYGHRYYTGKGGAISSLACNGQKYDEISGFRDNVSEGHSYPIGTLFVHAG
jgi:hypothetical protein